MVGGDGVILIINWRILELFFVRVDFLYIVCYSGDIRKCYIWREGFEV